MTRKTLSRRDFVALAGAGAAALVPRALGAYPVPLTWPGYARAIVIDNLASPGPFNTVGSFSRPWTAEMVANARASGMTAVNITVSGGGQTGAVAFENTVRNLAFISREMAAHPDVFMPIRTVADIRRAKESSRVGLIAGFQDTTMLEADVTRVDLFHDLGVRVMQLTYNVRNLVGDGCLEPGNAGLSGFGREVVGRMSDLGVLVDLSHCGRRTTLDAIAASRGPVAITHSGCAALADVPRNKTDEQLRLMAEKGGVIGIYTMPFLRTSGQAMAADFVRHVEHAVRICGEDHVGIGSDNSITPLDLTPAYRAAHVEFVRARLQRGIAAPGEAEDVFYYVPDLNSPRRMEQIADALAGRGHSASRIEKILGGNWLRLFGATWK